MVVCVPSPRHRVTRAMSQHWAELTASLYDHQKKTTSKLQKRDRRRSKTSTPFSTSRILPLRAVYFRLIQEKVALDLYALFVAAMFWNRTKGASARPVFLELLHRYPRPKDLAEAEEGDLVELMRPIGLQNIRAKRFVAFARAWLEDPPRKGCRRWKANYPTGAGTSNVGKNEVTGDEDPRDGWEIAHLPGMGPYALDSFRIFHRDVFRGLTENWMGKGAADQNFEPEWKRVIPTDKELKACVKWMWLKEGWLWERGTGKKIKASSARMKAERQRSRSASPENVTAGVAT